MNFIDSMSEFASDTKLYSPPDVDGVVRGQPFRGKTDRAVDFHALFTARYTVALLRSIMRDARGYCHGAPADD